MNGSTLLVIGGSSGIGYEVARQAAAMGAKLIVVGRDAQKLRKAAADLGAGTVSVSADAHDEQSLVRLFAQVDQFDHVVSMVGDSMQGPFLQTTEETMRHVLHSKFWTNWRIALHAAGKIRSGGTITLTSGTGGRPHAISATYVANLGIGALVQGLAVELAPSIRVNAVAPTLMDTPFWRHMPADAIKAAQVGFAEQVPLKRLAKAAEVASTYIHLITNGFISGQVVAVDGGVMLRV